MQRVPSKRCCDVDVDVDVVVVLVVDDDESGALCPGGASVVAVSKVFL